MLPAGPVVAILTSQNPGGRALAALSQRKQELIVLT
jgi:hypothetical protein